MTTESSLVNVGVDLGGTATRVVVRSGINTVGRAIVATASLGEGPPARRARRLWDLIAATLLPATRIASIGIAASGPIDLRSGVINNPDTLPWFSGFDLIGLMSTLADAPVTVENDAVAAAIGEYFFGAGRAAERLLLVTLGTGIGVSLLEEGRPFRLIDGQHPDAGHIPITGDELTCYCGFTGCWEQSASRLALERALEPFRNEESTTELVEAAAAQARKGDGKATEIFIEYGRKVGRGLALLHAVFGPSVTAIGGTVGDYLDLFGPGVNKSLVRAAGFAFPVPIVRAELGPEAGAIGASALSRSGFGDTSSAIQSAADSDHCT